MKLNISFPATGCQKVLEIEDEKRLRALYDKRMSHEVDGEHISDDFKGYIFCITGGNDKQGFPMKQGVLTSTRVRILMAKGASCYRPRKDGERKRKSVRGCIVSAELAVVNLVVVKKGDNEIPGLTDTTKPRRRAPKRATKIRKLFNLDKKTDDVRQYVVKRQITKEGKKPYFKSPKIQRLVTPRRLQRKRLFAKIKRTRYEASRKAATEFNALMAQRYKEAREKRAQKLQKVRSLSRSQGEAKAAPAAEPKKAAAPEKKSAPPAAAADKKPAGDKKQKPKKAAAAKKAAGGDKKTA